MIIAWGRVHGSSRLRSQVMEEDGQIPTSVQADGEIYSIASARQQIQVKLCTR